MDFNGDILGQNMRACTVITGLKYILVRFI